MTFKYTTSNILEIASQFMVERFPEITEYVVAGGAFRDLKLGRADKIKDIDIFYSELPATSDNLDPDRDIKKSHLKSAKRIFFLGHEVNLIAVKGAWELQELIDRFDIGLCQIGYMIDEYDVTFYASPLFWEDHDNRTLTIDRMTNQNHVDKMIEYFPDYELKNPFNFVRKSNNWFGWGYD